MKYSTILIIYNPNSTGRSKRKAYEVARDLRYAIPKGKIRVRASKRRGHAEALAYRAALLSRHALVISVSGDGGYNEVVNGALRAQALGRRATVGLVPAGNANDHYASVHRGDIITRISEGDEERIDVLRLRATSHGKRIQRYGHSYIGIGLTPQAGEKLNQKKLNMWQEIRIIAHVLLHPKSAKILHDGEIRHYDSLIFSNVGRMSKIIRVPKYGSSDDGVFEVSYLYQRNKIELIRQLANAALLGMKAEITTGEFVFETLRSLPVQIDGEIVKLAAGMKVTIDIRPHALRCIV